MLEEMGGGEMGRMRRAMSVLAVDKGRTKMTDVGGRDAYTEIESMA